MSLRARYEQALAGIPMSPNQVRESIAKLERGTRSVSARKAMASLAVKHGNFTDDARALWAAYLENLNA